MPITSSSFISERLPVLGHRYLWKGGIEHNDTSVSNLMYDKANNDAGILKDFDLTHMSDPVGPNEHHSWHSIFLQKQHGKGYRHDCESFVPLGSTMDLLSIR